MAKKNQRDSQLRGFGTASITSNLNKAEALMRKGQWAQAEEILEALDRQHPHQEEVLRLWAALCYQIQDFTEYQIICRQLTQLKPDDGGLHLALGGAYMAGARTTLALQAFEKFLERSPHHAKTAEIREAVAKLEAVTQRVIAESDFNGEALTLEQRIEAAALHELAQLYMAAGDVDTGRQVSEQLLQIHPTYLPARNNLSLMMALDGDWDGAIAMVNTVLEASPDNPHALSNLTRYQRLSGQTDAAQQTLGRLKAIVSDKPDVWQKQAEALSFMGDYEGILEVVHQAEASADSLPPLLYHLAAVATLRSGSERRAREYWNKSLEVAPGFDLAAENLADLQQSITQRQSPWAFPLNYWLSPEATDDIFLLQQAAELDREDELRTATQNYLQNHPEVETLIPMLLDQGDGPGRQLALNLALMTDQPEMHQVLKTFALSQSGSDAMRQQAAQVVARRLRETQMRLWIAGEWREVALLNCEIHEELQHHHSPEVDKLTKQAVSALKEESWAKAEYSLKQALKLEPTALDLSYNLAIAYERLGKADESLALVQALHEQNPDYAFARIAIVRGHLKKGELAEAEAVLQPLANRHRYHYSEFAAFCDIRLELLVAQKNYEAARSFLDTWIVMGAPPDGAQYWRLILANENPHRALGTDRGWNL
jgi:tetratricopeptide (TPR) repeat protein